AKRLDEVVEMDSDRKRCRNPHCRQKLKHPTDNDHHAFCCLGCFNSFYLNRCCVCEKPLRDKRGGRLYCRPPNKCKQEAAKWPQKYEFQSTFVRQVSQEVPILRASKSALKPSDLSIECCAIGHGTPASYSRSFMTLPAS